MLDKEFVDTNILIYSYSEDEPLKKNAANRIFDEYAGKPLPVYGDGKNMRDWVNVEDIMLV